MSLTCGSSAELTRRVATAEEEARYPGPEDAHAQRAAQLEKATAGARSGVEELTAQLRALEAQREEVKAELAQLELQQKELEKVKGEVEPALR